MWVDHGGLLCTVYSDREIITWLDYRGPPSTIIERLQRFNQYYLH